MTSRPCFFYNAVTETGWGPVMVDLARRRERVGIAGRMAGMAPADMDEMVALCPTCKAFETLWFADDILVPTRKFYQVDRQIYHDCGSLDACRLMLRFVKQ